jgi:ketosteroid isomerase-like protein
MRELPSALLILCAVPAVAAAQAAPPADGAGVERFNQAFADATRRMDDSATIALWEEDGISLLPSTPPVVGRRAIGDLITGVSRQFPGAHMLSFDLACHGLEGSGPWASEWCTEHQVVRISADNTFDGWGKMLLVLHRGRDGHWRLSREMWNQAQPDSAAKR